MRRDLRCVIPIVDGQCDIVEAKEPKMLYFAHHVSEDGREATTVQVHADANNMSVHMELVADQIRRRWSSTWTRPR